MWAARGIFQWTPGKSLHGLFPAFNTRPNPSRQPGDVSNDRYWFRPAELDSDQAARPAVSRAGSKHEDCQADP